MKAEEFVGRLSDVSQKNMYRFEQLRAKIPLGVDSAENIVTAYREENLARYNRLCVTGAKKTEFISRLVATLSCLYDRSEIMFLVLSPNQSYADLLRLSADVTIPFISAYADYAAALETVKGLSRIRSLGTGETYPRLMIILDGLENLPDIRRDGYLQPYKMCFDVTAYSGVEVIAGAELRESIFSGSPGAFVGIGNCLVTTKGEGKADVTYVNADSALTPPREIVYPDDLALAELIDFFNALR
jgi:hypothetical protein